MLRLTDGMNAKIRLIIIYLQQLVITSTGVRSAINKRRRGNQRSVSWSVSEKPLARDIPLIYISLCNIHFMLHMAAMWPRTLPGSHCSKHVATCGVQSMFTPVLRVDLYTVYEHGLRAIPCLTQ